MLTAGKRLAVFSIREGKGGSIWVRAGSAFVNKDGSLNVLLDVLPLDGKLHVREAADKRDGVQAARTAGAQDKPVLACLMAEQGIRTQIQLDGERIPSYAFPETAARVLAVTVLTLKTAITSTSLITM